MEHAIPLLVTLSQIVENQISEQTLFIAGHSIDNALAWESKLRKAINNLADTRGYAIGHDASKLLNIEVRKLLFEKTYLIHYQVDSTDRIVPVIGFRHGARLPRSGEP